MPPWAAKEKIGTLLLASEMPVPIPRSSTVDDSSASKLLTRQQMDAAHNCVSSSRHSDSVIVFDCMPDYEDVGIAADEMWSDNKAWTENVPIKICLFHCIMNMQETSQQS